METVKTEAKKTKMQITQKEYLKLFKSFSRKQKMRIAEEINMELFEELWKKADADLPDIDGLDDLILEGIKTLRYGHEG